MKKTLIYLIIINIIAIIAQNFFSYKAVDAYQIRAIPPFRSERSFHVNLNHKKRMQQTFTPKANKISAIAFCITANKRDGESFIYLKDGKKILQLKKIKNSDLKQYFNVFEFTPIELKKKKYTIEIATNSKIKNSYYIWGTRYNNYLNGEFSVNNVVENGDLIFKTYYPITPIEMLTKKISPTPPLASTILIVTLLEIIFIITSYSLALLSDLKITNY